jgi:hypothetical protein
MQIRDVAVDIVLETTAFIWAAADVIRIGSYPESAIEVEGL